MPQIYIKRIGERDYVTEKVYDKVGRTWKEEVRGSFIPISLEK